MLEPDNLKRQTFRLRSFVRRDSRLTPAQARAYGAHWHALGVKLEDGQADFTNLFGRVAPTYLEIGFGMGQSLLKAAEMHPSQNFIGVETHLPGIGALMLSIENTGVANVRIAYADVIDVLDKIISPASLAGIQIFFPDPWQKRRHHARRLIQPAFLEKLAYALQPNGSLHLATDWDDYAVHMMQVLSASLLFTNTAGEQQFAKRSAYRPIISKFEQRALREGRDVYELAFVKSEHG